MNTITIDSVIYQFVANYAAKRKVSVSSIVEGHRDRYVDSLIHQ